MNKKLWGQACNVVICVTRRSECVKKLYFITVTFQTKLKVFRQGFADYEDGILVSLIRRRNEPLLTEFFEALRPFNAIFLAYHQN
jgi:hypothetical protein